MADEEPKCVFCGGPLKKTFFGPIVVVADHKIPEVETFTCPFSGSPMLEVAALEDRMNSKERKLNGEQ